MRERIWTPMVEDFSRPIRQRTASRPGSQRGRTLGRVAYPDTVWLFTRCDRGPGRGPQPR